MRPRDTYKKYILQKNWVKTVIPAFSSGQSNLPPSIWGPSRQLDDQHKNTNMNDKDHLVGELTNDNNDNAFRVDYDYDDDCNDYDYVNDAFTATFRVIGWKQIFWWKFHKAD